MAKKKNVTVVVKPKRKNKRSKQQKQIGLLGTALRALGTSAGGAVGGYFGNPVTGAAVGNSLGATISRWLGAGDYTVTSNSLVNSMKASGSIPMMHSNDQTITVRHKEFVMTVLSSTNYVIRRSLIINPGRETTFPWLHTLANNFQEYRIKGMVYHYVPTSGNAVASTNSALGSVMLQTSYRSTDSAPADKIELLNEYWSSEARPSESFCHPIECNPKENPFNIQYVRSDGAILPATDSPLLYDLGVTHVAVQGQQINDIALGDLWITYEVELKKPIIKSNSTLDVYVWSGKTTSTATLSTPFTSMSQVSGNLQLTLGSNSITIPSTYRGVFNFYLVFQATTQTLTNFTITSSPTVVNCTIEDFQPGQTVIGGATTGSATTFVYAFCIRKNQRELAATITMPATSGSGSITTNFLNVYAYPDL